MVPASLVLRAGLGAALIAAAVPAARGQNVDVMAGPPIVIELFTSQGCDTCPPADAFAGELTKRGDVLTLSLHVDYWDYLGWKDPYAQRAFSERQRAYSRALAQRFVYTPQMIVDGRLQDVGSDRKAIEHAIAKIKQQAIGRLVLRQVGVGPKVAVAIENPAGVDVSRAKPATIWLAIYDPLKITVITRGELAGQTLPSYNIVRRLERIGNFVGEPITVAVDLSAAERDQGCAIIVQSIAAGPILAALPLTRN